MPRRATVEVLLPTGKPIMPIHVPAFILTTWLLAMLPGAGQALMFRQTLNGGQRAAWASIAGTVTGLLIWSSTAALGLSAVLLANPAAYALVRVAGGAVLVVLGVNTLLGLRRDPAAADGAGSGQQAGGLHVTGWRAYLVGLATNLGNPKAGVFAVSLLPQFVTPHGPVLLSSVGLGVLWALVTACWYVLFTTMVERGRSIASRPVVHRRLQAITGGVLILLGAVVAVGA